MGKFSKIPETAFQQVQLGAGILLSTFEPNAGTIDLKNIIGATSGGMNFSAIPSFIDQGEDMDNCPKGMKELMELDAWTIKLDGTLLTVTADTVKKLIALADVAGDKITPRGELKDSDFADLWFVGDYSDKTGEKNGGFIAIHMMNALSTGGFNFVTEEKKKGKFKFTFSAHYSMTQQTVVPFEAYVKAGTQEA